MAMDISAYDISCTSHPGFPPKLSGTITHAQIGLFLFLGGAEFFKLRNEDAVWQFWARLDVKPRGRKIQNFKTVSSNTCAVEVVVKKK